MKSKKLRLIYKIVLLLVVFIIVLLTVFLGVLDPNILISTYNEPNEKLEKSEYELFDSVNTILKQTENNKKTYYSKYEQISRKAMKEVETQGIKPHIDSKLGTKYISYEDFGVYADGKNDDYEAIMKTHIYANENNFEVRAQSKEYHIFRENEYIPIPIKTNTNWNKASFVLHDENIVDKNTKDYPIFQIVSFEKEKIINNRNILDKITINKQTSNIPNLAGYGDCLCIVYNDNKKQFIRQGINENSGKPQQDIFRIDNFGNVLNEIQWNFEHISKIVLIPIPKEKLEIKDANFITILPKEEQEQPSGYYNRNIICHRSNVKISNINHTLSDNNAIGGPYYGFIRLSKVADVTIENCHLVAHTYKSKSNYDLIIDNAVNITMDNIKSDSITDNNKWGITGTNYTKDVVYKNCELNRIDAHSGVHNLTIENCTIGVKGLTLIGSGSLKLNNVTRVGGKSFIELRPDYGSTWNGDISIENATWDTDESQQIISFKTSYVNDKPHDYGYELYLPNITIDGLKINDNNIKNQESYTYIFDNTSTKTGTENGDMRNNYKLPQKVNIKDYEIVSGKKLKLFSNKFYDSLEKIGINLSIPLYDKIEVEIKDEEQSKIENSTISNKNIIINRFENEGITTKIKINDDVRNEKVIKLEQDGNYKIEIIYQNSNGKKENEKLDIIIDKTAPTITGVTEGKSYKYNVTPKIFDNNLKEVKLMLNGESLKDFKEGKELTEEGHYQLTAIDKAENITVISFYIVKLEDTDYKVLDEKIENIEHYTKKSEFSQKFLFNKKYNIYRNGKALTDNEYIATGDLLKTETGEGYILIVSGDINKDGKVDIKDIVKLRKYLVSPNNNKLNEIELIAADANLDKKEIGIKDLVRMRIIALSIKK